MLFFTGVIAVSATDYKLYNGYSNEFWGLGLEDDDFYLRIRRRNVTIVRPQLPVEYLKYKTVYQDPIEPNPDRQNVFDSGYMRFETDGQVNLKFNLTDFKLQPQYTHLIVHLWNNVKDNNVIA